MSEALRTRKAGPGALFALLRRNPDFARLFWATVISFAGDWFAFVAVSGFVTEATGHAGSAAYVYAASVLPTFLLSPVAGVIADRVDRKKMLVVVDVLRVIPALGLIAALYWPSPLLAIVCVALLAALSAFFEPIAGAVTPNVVEPEDLPVAQAGLSSVWGTMLFVGAALGGLVAATLGRQASFLLNALTFAASAWLVFRIRRPLQQGHAAKGTFVSHLGEVWTLARSSLVTRSLLSTKLGVGLSNGIVGLLPAFATTRFGTGDEGVGLLLACRGAGSLVGAFGGQRLARGEGRRLFLVCGGAIVSYGLAYLTLPYAPSLGWAAACVFVAHMGGGAQWSLSVYGLQVTTVDTLRGRVLSLDFGLATLAIGVSSVLAGAGAERVGLDRMATGIAAVGLAYGVLFLLWTRPLWSGKRDPLA